MTVPARPTPRIAGRPLRLLSGLGAALLVLGTATVARADDTASTPASPEPTADQHAGAPGNNGTVKVGDETDLDEERPENDPHLPCTFDVQWYGYDSGWGPITSDVDLMLQAPTAEEAGVTMTLASGDTSPTFTGNGGQPGAGDGRDHLEWYTLSFTGDPHPEQGYHVRLTVDTPHSKGSTTKSKVFWVGPCEETAPPAAPTTSSPTASVPVTEESGTTSPSPVATTTGTPFGEASGASETPSATILGTESAAPVVGGTGTPGDDEDAAAAETTDAAVRGVQAQQGPGVAAPTAVAAGLPGVLHAVQAHATSPSGAVLVTLGLALVGPAAAVAARRRRGAHQY